MILYKAGMGERRIKRPSKTIDIAIDENPQRPIYVFKTNKDRVKFIKNVESMVRKSLEYKEFISFLKKNMDMNRCAVLHGLKTGSGKRYRIEIHHEPFTLFDIVETVLRKFEDLSMEINPFAIADEVTELHYDGKVGLVPLSITMHELVHNDKIFIPLQLIYHKYDEFFDEYQSWINPQVIEKIEAKVNLSMKCPDILSDILDTEFVYVNVDGISLPEIPPEWAGVASMDGLETTMAQVTS